MLEIWRRMVIASAVAVYVVGLFDDEPGTPEAAAAVEAAGR